MKIGRNDPCPCGSGKKYKKCCLDKQNFALSTIPAQEKRQFDKMQAPSLIKKADYRRNHYVPKWYQYRFLPSELREKKFYYLDLKPNIAISNKRKHTRKALLRWGPSNCFYEEDLYTTKFLNWESTEIEEKFFGNIDSSGRAAINYFATFQHPSVDGKAFQNLLRYMSIQKLRTPKGLTYLSELVRITNKNLVLIKMQQLQQIFCALWTECIWSIIDASGSETKFIISDHPVTVYNRGCLPGSKWCLGHRDPDIAFSGTHTLFPLSLDKALILTNLSWVRNPYDHPRKARPNFYPFRNAMFNFMHIQTGRSLTDVEVNEINYVTKMGAYRYVAAGKKEWLYPENKILSQRWEELGQGYLFMPDPRSVTFSSEIIIGYDNKRADFFDEYGRKPWQPDYNNKAERDKEWETFHRFQGEFARVFGPKRRGRTFEFGQLDNGEDSPDYHAYHLSLEDKFKTKDVN